MGFFVTVSFFVIMHVAFAVTAKRQRAFEQEKLLVNTMAEPHLLAGHRSAKGLVGCCSANPEDFTINKECYSTESFANKEALTYRSKSTAIQLAGTSRQVMPTSA